MVRPLSLTVSTLALALALTQPACRGSEPGNAEAAFKLGLACSRSKDWNGAIEAYRRALALDPRHAKAQNNLANVYFRRGDFAAAAREYRQALAVDPGYLLAYYHYGWVERQLNHPESAEQAFRQCLALAARTERERGAQLECLAGLGALRYRANDFPAVVSAMEQVLAANPAHPEAHHYLGLAYRGLGRLEDAWRELEQHQENLRSQRRRDPVEDEEP